MSIISPRFCVLFNIFFLCHLRAVSRTTRRSSHLSFDVARREKQKTKQNPRCDQFAEALGRCVRSGLTAVHTNDEDAIGIYARLQVLVYAVMCGCHETVGTREECSVYRILALCHILVVLLLSFFRAYCSIAASCSRPMRPCPSARVYCK